MFELINTVMRMFKAKGPVSAMRLGEAADDHIFAYWEHLDRRLWEQGRADRLAGEAERAARAAAWEKLPSEERDAIIAWCDDLDAQGRLEDHPFFDQWLALRMEGYVGD